MDINEVYFEELYDNLKTELDIINEGTKDVLTLAGLCIDAVKNTVSKLKQYVIENGFSSVDEEIRFFKTTKPRFYSLLVYYGKLYELELNRPAGGKEIEIEYFKKVEARIFYFYEKYRDFYQYHRAGMTYLDEKYFTRNNKIPISLTLENGLDSDVNFTTGQDFLIAKIVANERLKNYIEAGLSRLKQENIINLFQQQPIKDLTWTASKASLLELMYGLHAIRAFNNGNAELQQIAAHFEKNFDIRFGNYHRAFQEVRSRKKNRTQFLDELKRQLIEKMDSMDDNLKF